MPKVKIDDFDSFAFLRLNNEVSNAIDPELVCDLAAAVKQVRREFQGLVLAGGDEFFCTGFDLPKLLPLSKREMGNFLFEYDQMIFDIFSVPLPTVCAIKGHAIGGGNILALTCDFRFAAEGEKLIGLNEVKLGLPVPYLADMILRQLIGDRAASAMLYHGELMSMSDAHHNGLLDEILPPEDVEARAIQKISAMVGLPVSGFGTIKDNRTESISVRFWQNQAAKRQYFLNGWFNASVRETLMEAAKKF
ncbi:MAG: enoyl-CoA hydratase/isomerase family protein [Syntrophobacter sp.]